MVYSGIDLHRRFCFITTVDGDSKVLDQMKLAHDELAILASFARFNQPPKGKEQKLAAPGKPVRITGF